MSNRLEDLEPITRGLCHAFLQHIEEKMMPPVRITHTLRTMDEQLHLYAKGRRQTDKGWVVEDRKAIVTWAKPGASPHNYGAAFDICVAGSQPYPDDDQLWEAYGLAGEICGLEWGGRWKKLVDRPHFERADWEVLRKKA